MSDYPYDDDVLDEVARRLYEALPAMYRVPDDPPAGRGDLKSLLDVLSVPLAVLRQSIQELHADLFIDSADDRVVPYLAEMVGTALVFPDAESNRRDVRGTVGWRRRKGTPAALEEMGSELTGQSVVLQEGWKRIQLAQDLDLPRLDRVAVDVRPAVVAEQATGPLDALFHTVDMRRISATTGRRHPRHVAHWLHPTITFPLREATAADRSLEDSDVRFVIDPLGARQPLRARRIPGDPEPFVDRVQEQHFAAAPERWFGRDGGFTIRVCSLPAAIAGAPPAERTASVRVADRQLGRGDAALTALRLPSRGWRGAVRVELGLARVPAGGPADVWSPADGGANDFAVRAGIDLDAAGVVGTSPGAGGTPGGTRVPMLRLTPLGGAAARFFPGATLELASAAPGSAAAVDDSELAREGFLRGALHVEIPPLAIRQRRLLHIAADGSLYEAVAPDGTMLEMPRVEDDLQLDGAALLGTGPGAAWPPLGVAAEPRMLARVPAAPGRGPAVLHGALPFRLAGGSFAQLPVTARCALAFAVQLEQPGGPAFRPFQRLSWTGRDPRQGTWTALGTDGTPGDAAAEYAAVAALRDADPDRVALAVRFECSDSDATLCPGEIAWSADDGGTVLVHLPQLDVAPLAAGAPWPGPEFGFASEAVRVAEDGSTWASESTAGRRVSLGAVAPIAEAAGLRRRRVRWRRLCAWDAEDWAASPPETLALTQRGKLDVDVQHGLFAFAAEEPPQAWPPGPDGEVPPNVATDFEEGATMHLGARPAAREPLLDLRLAVPTRLVSRSGALHPDAPAALHEVPRYASLTAALAAVSDEHEVIQFEDSATYPGETPVWPECTSLTIQAAERERPTILVDDWTVPAQPVRYAALTLRGLAVGGEGWTGMALPPSDRVALELCSVLHAENRIVFADLADGTYASVVRCATAGLELAGTGVLAVADSIVDARPGLALRAPTGEIQLDRVSVGGDVEARVLEASEVIFDGRVTVEDRFRGCVRYSRVASGSTLPRAHRTVTDVPVRVVSHNRRDPAWWRLRADAEPAISRGAENGSEMGAFALTQHAERMAGFERRLGEFTPAGLVTGIIRID